MATLKGLMTTLSKKGLQEQRGEIICNFTGGRTRSARDLTPTEINHLLEALKNAAKPNQKDLDKKRKRLLAAIFGLFKVFRKQPTMEYVKGIACRAAKKDSFNDIPPAKLVSLYNAFIHAQRDYSFARGLIANIEVDLAELN